MAGFRDIVGQSHIKEHFKSALASGKVNHAYLLEGELGSGKEFIAKVFAKALMCESRDEDGEACDECHSCKQAATNNHPDIRFVRHEKPNTISVDDIRQQVVNDVGDRPYSSKYKIYIIEEAEKMTPQAQNALLKTLEEPPEYAVIILLVTNASLLLDTILSRCTRLTLRAVEDKVLKEYLMKNLRVPDYRADVCVAFSRGNFGKAKQLAENEDFDNISREIVGMLTHIHSMDTSDVLQTIKTLSDYKMNINDVLDIMMAWYRDVLMYKATMDMDCLVFKEKKQDVFRMASESAYDGIEEIIDHIDKTKNRLKANVNFDIAMELLLMTIKEN